MSILFFGQKPILYFIFREFIYSRNNKYFRSYGETDIFYISGIHLNPREPNFLSKIAIFICILHAETIQNITYS